MPLVRLIAGRACGVRTPCWPAMKRCAPGARCTQHTVVWPILTVSPQQRVGHAACTEEISQQASCEPCSHAHAQCHLSEVHLPNPYAELHCVFAASFVCSYCRAGASTFLSTPYTAATATWPDAPCSIPPRGALARLYAWLPRWTRRLPRSGYVKQAYLEALLCLWSPV